MRAQTPAAPAASSTYAAVRNVRMIEEKDGPAVEILSTKPLVPAIQAIDNPPRLVIDLPGARMMVRQKRIHVGVNQISALRADQFQENPPVARVVVDLIAPRSSTWEAAGNRLVVHLGRNPPLEANKTPFQPPSVPALTRQPQPMAAVVKAAGPVALVGSGLASGSSITAGADTAVLSMTSGGEVHVCPGTTISVTPAQNGRNVMLGMSTGAIEAHFTLDASSNSVMTPDFRILLTGPGQFNYAISSDNHGNTCVRALPGNTASAIVSELMGDRTYQVKATDQLVFRAGSLDKVDMDVPLECGCPPPRESVLRANRDVPDAPAAANVNLAAKPADGGGAITVTTQPSILPANAPTSTPAGASPAAESKEIHVQVEAPFVFRGTDPPPAPMQEARSLPAESRSYPAPALSDPLPPPARQTQNPGGVATTTATPHHGFFGKLRGFFAAMFR